MGSLLAKWVYPHFHNDNHPYAIRHQTLFLFVVVLASAQILSNTLAGNPKILGYTANINKTEIISLTNSERSAKGAPSLAESSSLSQAAALKADHMFKNNYWAHFGPDGTSPWLFFNQVDYAYTFAGENLAKDFQSSAGVVAGWMASTAGHKENILQTSFTEIGVAVKNGVLLGEETTLVVQLFGRPVSYTAAAPTIDQPTGTAARVEDKLNIESGEPIEESTADTVIATEPTGGVVGQATEALNLANVIDNLSTGQKTSFGLLFILGSLFGLDSATIFRRRQHRENSHSALHASVVIILMITLAVQSVGSIV